MSAGEVWGGVHHHHLLPPSFHPYSTFTYAFYPDDEVLEGGRNTDPKECPVRLPAPGMILSLTSPHLTPPHLTSPLHLPPPPPSTLLHFTSPPLTYLTSSTSPHFTSPHLTSPLSTSAHLSSPHFTSPHLTSLHLTSPPQRNLEAGRTCLRKCNGDRDCLSKRKVCLCDGMCGLSCVNPGQYLWHSGHVIPSRSCVTLRSCGISSRSCVSLPGHMSSPPVMWHYRSHDGNQGM
ncbi:putative high molecular weight rhoptry protein 2-like [Homarus americanus]|uniref:Putative high molecular weight rhoptry protein 2-like n=1 Tax=Homarus americanus TaxID=6706 RepID=A0A8J5N1R6_HOMAM|nr:putative high molecular weight rhoptry protein 2-like [Homarus americanus]